MTLRFRLVLIGAAAIIVALALSAFGLAALFGAHVERRAVIETSSQLDQLLSGLDSVNGNVAMVTELADVRFTQPYSGYYWQIDLPGRTLRSRSLWDQALEMPDDLIARAEIQTLHMSGPQEQRLLATLRTVTLPVRLGTAPATAIIAIDLAGLTTARQAFFADIVPYMVILAIILIGAGWAQITFGLRPLARLRQRVVNLNQDPEARMGTDWPLEVSGLAHELDTVLDARAADLERARMRAADLAHGLKTPLQAMMGEAALLRGRGAVSEAQSIEEIAAAMRRTVDHELTRARRAQNTTPSTSNLHRTLQQIVSVIGKTPDGNRVSWEIEIPDNLMVPLTQAELAEALGAVIENAVRHAKSAVTLRASRDRQTIMLDIIDDGPGIPDALHNAMLSRFGRRDERGSGLGLTIANEIMDTAGGDISMNKTTDQFCVCLRFPAQPVAL